MLSVPNVESGKQLKGQARDRLPFHILAYRYTVSCLMSTGLRATKRTQTKCQQQIRDELQTDSLDAMKWVMHSEMVSTRYVHQF
jgi:hypothetical protein